MAAHFVPPAGPYVIPDYFVPAGHAFPPAPPPALLLHPPSGPPPVQAPAPVVVAPPAPAGYTYALPPAPAVQLGVIMRRLSPRWLNAHGYINFERGFLEKMHPDFYAPGALSPTANALARDHSIHLIFGRHHWPGISNQEFDSLRPALLLASRFLDNPDMLPFFKGIYDRHKYRTFEDAKAKATTTLGPTEDLQKFGKAELTEDPHFINAYQDLRRLAGKIVFDTAHATLIIGTGLAETSPNGTLPGLSNT